MHLNLSARTVLGQPGKEFLERNSVQLVILVAVSLLCLTTRLATVKSG